MCFVPASLELVGMLLLAPRLLGIGLLDAAIMGTVLAAVSPAVVVPKMLRLMEEGYGKEQSIPQLIMAGASVDDVFVIVLFTSFTGLAGGGAVSPLDFVRIPTSILFGLGGGILCGFLLALFFQRVHIRDSFKVILIFGALVFRMPGVFICLLGTKLRKKERLFCMLAYTPKAMVQAAIGSIPLSMGLSCGAAVLTAAVLAILITAPLGAFAIDMTYKKLILPEKEHKC